MQLALVVSKMHLRYTNLLHLMCAITCAHDSTHATSFMKCVKNNELKWNLLFGTLERRKLKKEQRHKFNR